MTYQSSWPSIAAPAIIRAIGARIVVALAARQEGLPISHRVYPGSMVDVISADNVATPSSRFKDRGGSRQPMTT